MTKLRAAKAAAGAAFLLATAFIAGWEGLRLVGYYDIVGVPTACFGHTGIGVRVGEIYTKEACEALLRQDLSEAWVAVDDLVIAELSDGEHIAYASFVFNLGAGAFSNSTLLRKLNAGDRMGACKELLRWNKAGKPKRPIKGLTARRKAEFQVCIGGLQ